MDARCLLGILLGCGLWIVGPESCCAADDRAKHQEATQAYDAGDWATAVRLWSELLDAPDAAPPADDISLFLGEALVQLGRSEEAGKRFQTFLAEHPEDPRASHAEFRLGEAAYLTGQYEQARSRLETYLTRGSEGVFRAYASSYLGEIALSQSQWPEATRRFQEALAVTTETALADHYRFGLARAAEGEGRLDDADRFYAAVASGDSPWADDALLQGAILRWRRSDDAGARVLLDRLVDSQSDSPLAARGLYLMGRLHDRAGDSEAAIAAYEAAEAAAGTDHDAFLTARFERARTLHATAKQEQAETLWRWFVEDTASDPFADDAALLWIEYCFDQKRWDEIETIGEQCERLHPQGDRLPQILEYRGRAAFAAERFDVAARHWQRLLSITDSEPQDEALRLSRQYLTGLALVRSGQDTEGLALLEPLAGKLRDSSSEAGRSLAALEANQRLERHDQVIAIAKDYLKTFPDGLEAAVVHRQLCEALSAAGQWQEADEAWLNYAKIYPDHEGLDATLHNMVSIAKAANAEEWSNRWLDRSFERLESGNPTPEALLLAAQARKQAGDQQQAAAWLERLQERFPDAPEAAKASMLLAQEAQARGDLVEAERLYRDIATRFEGTPFAEGAHLAWAITLSRSDSAEERVEGQRQLLEMVEANGARSDAALYELARASLESNDLSASINSFERLVRQWPGSEYRPDALYRLAEISLKRRDLHEAETWLQTLEADHPDSELREVSELMAIRVAMAAEQWERVLARSETFLDSYDPGPRTATVRFWRAESLRQLNRLEEASREFQALVAESNEGEEAWWPWVSIQLARIAVEQKSWADGLAWCAKATQQDPEEKLQTEIDPLIGRCRLETGDFAGAREAWERVARLPTTGSEEKAAEALWWIGESWQREGNYEAAIDAYRRVSTLYADSPWHQAALLSSGKAQEQAGDLRQAMLTYARLLKEFPESAQSVEASQRLTSLKLSVDTETDGVEEDRSTDRSTRTASPPTMPPTTGERSAQTDSSTVPRRER